MSASALTDGRPVGPSRSVLRPLGLADVDITGGFWADCQRVNGEATMGHARSCMDEVRWTGNVALDDHPVERCEGVRRLRGRS